MGCGPFRSDFRAQWTARTSQGPRDSYAGLLPQGNRSLPISSEEKQATSRPTDPSGLPPPSFSEDGTVPFLPRHPLSYRGPRGQQPPWSCARPVLPSATTPLLLILSLFLGRLSFPSELVRQEATRGAGEPPGVGSYSGLWPAVVGQAGLHPRGLGLGEGRGGAVKDNMRRGQRGTRQTRQRRPHGV